MAHQPTRCSTTQESSIRVHRPEPVSAGVPNAVSRIEVGTPTFRRVTLALTARVLHLYGATRPQRHVSRQPGRKRPGSAPVHGVACSFAPDRRPFLGELGSARSGPMPEP